MRVEWKRRTDFAEVAEALEISTGQIIAQYKPKGFGASLLVIWSDDGADDGLDTPIKASRLDRNEDNVLHHIQTETAGTLGDFLKEVTE